MLLIIMNADHSIPLRFGMNFLVEMGFLYSFFQGEMTSTDIDVIRKF
jgi:hypothetical protein